ncbi:LPXTG cell wall anchor domain-containing protein [Kitasatospora griseola]|uniref:LPXTG cell wall anchor domain-containing protein n=1 Tax=Kitasatospora griseola TaxID=2064 RepID=UPI00381DC181
MDLAADTTADCLITNRFVPGGQINVEKITVGGTGAFRYLINPRPGRPAVVRRGRDRGGVRGAEGHAPHHRALPDTGSSSPALLVVFTATVLLAGGDTLFIAARRRGS